MLGVAACCKHTHIHTFNGPMSGTTRVSRYQKGKTNLDFAEARDSEWQWHQLGRMEVCTSLQTDNHASTPPLSFLQAGCPSCRPTNSVKALKAKSLWNVREYNSTGQCSVGGCNVPCVFMTVRWRRFGCWLTDSGWTEWRWDLLKSFRDKNDLPWSYPRYSIPRCYAQLFVTF